MKENTELEKEINVLIVLAKAIRGSRLRTTVTISTGGTIILNPYDLVAFIEIVTVLNLPPEVTQEGKFDEPIGNHVAWLEFYYDGISICTYVSEKELAEWHEYKKVPTAATVKGQLQND